MSQSNCPQCGHDLLSEVGVCPNCGYVINLTQNNIKSESSKSSTFSNNSNSVFVIHNKETKIKYLIVGLALGFLAGFITSRFFKEEHPAVASKITIEQKEQYENIEDKKEENVNQEEIVSVNDDTKITTINLGESVTVNTDEGNFEISINALKSKEGQEIWNLNEDMLIGTIQCEINNIDYSGIYEGYLHGYDIAVTHPYLKVFDQNELIREFYEISGPEDGEYAVNMKLPVGSKGKVSYPFVFEKDTQKAKIIINDMYQVDLDIS